MANIKICYVNILEAGTVTLGTGTAHTSYPLARLTDRLIGRIFKTTAAETTTIKLDQDVTISATDQLLIPAGHSLNGMTLDLQWSDNDSVWNNAVTQWVQGDALIIDKPFTELTHRYWRFVITSPGSAPEIPELLLTQTYQFEKNPTINVSGLESRFNVINSTTSNGGDRFLVLGPAKKQRNYKIKLARATQKDNIITFNAAWAGSNPFYLYDHEGTWIWGKLNRPLDLAFQTSIIYNFIFSFTEVIS